jgi:hypothetical protein
MNCTRPRMLELLLELLRLRKLPAEDAMVKSFCGFRLLKSRARLPDGKVDWYQALMNV